MRRILAAVIFLGFLNTIGYTQEEALKDPERFNIPVKQDTTVAREYFIKGEEFYNIADYDSAIVYFEKAAYIYDSLARRWEEPGIWGQYITCYIEIGKSYATKGQLEKAHFFINHAIETGKQKISKEHLIISKSYLVLATLYNMQEKFEQAIEYNNKSLTIRLNKLKENHPEIANNYLLMGNISFSKGLYDQALDYYFNSLSIKLKSFGEEHSSIAGSYHNIAMVYRSKSNYDKALEYYSKSLAIEQALRGEDHPEVARIYYSIAIVYRYKGHYEQALDNYHKSLKIYLKTFGENHPFVADNYNNIGVIFKRKGEFDQALNYYYKSLAIRRNLQGVKHSRVASNYNNIGNVYREKGDYDKALNYHKNALKIRRQVLGDSHSMVARSYNNIGIVYDLKGDYDRAIDFYSKSLAIRIQVLGENHYDTATSYTNLGIVSQYKGEYEDAVQYYDKALAIHQSKFEENNPHIATAFLNQGSLYLAKREFTQALNSLNKSLTIWGKITGYKHPMVAKVYDNLGQVHEISGEYNDGIKYYNQSLRIWQDLFGNKHPGIGKLYLSLARINNLDGNHNVALEYCQKAIIALVSDFANENINTNPNLKNINDENALLNSLSFKAALLKKLSNKTDFKYMQLALSTYALAIQLIEKVRGNFQDEESKLQLAIKAKNIIGEAILTALVLKEADVEVPTETAFVFSEKSKANILLASLSEAAAKQFAGIPDSLAEQERQLRIDLAGYNRLIAGEQEHGAKRDSAKIALWQDRLFSLNREYEALIDTLEKNYPDYYRLKYDVNTIALPALQEKLAQKQATLLEYFVGDSLLHIFTVNAAGLTVHSQAIDSSFGDLVTDCYRSIRKQRKKDYLNSAATLYKILIDPVKDKLAGAENLVIIPDGVLSYLPFEALISENPLDKNPDLRTVDLDFTRLDYLLKQFSISYHYSATLWAEAKEEERRDTPAGEFIGFAPVFSENDQNGYILSENLRSGYRSDSDEGYDWLTRDGSRLSELQYSEEELRAITGLFKNNGAGYFHDQATEANFKQQAGNYRYVHVATHSFVNERYPALSAIAFAQPQDSNAAEDGMLYAGETFNLDLNADLVTLSSCESGIGQLVQGEGLMALTRGFLYSGAKNVLVSLWKVSDRKTRDLMAAFYKAHRKPMDFSRALRAAKLKMIEDPDSAFPFKWSAFVLIGG